MRTVLSVIGALIAASAAFGAGEKPKAKAPAMMMPPPAVLAGKVTIMTNTVTKKYVGMLKALFDASLVARVSGNIDDQLLPHGSFVKKDQVILQLEDTVYKAQVQAAKALVAQTEAELNFAKNNFARQKKLLGQKATSETTYEEAQKVYLTTMAKLDNYKAQLVQAQDNLKYTKVRSPFDGRMGKVVMSPGNYVTPGTMLVRIVSISPVNVDFSISSRDFLEIFGSMDALKARAKVAMFLADGTRYPGDGRIIYMSNSVDSSTDTIEIRASFENKEGKLIPGGLVTIRLGLLDPPKMPAVPLTAILNDKQGSYVYVIGPENRALRRNVTLGPVIGVFQLVSKGLKAGETVITGGTNKVMFPGMPVKPVFADSAKGAEKK